MALADNIISYWKLDEASGNAADSAGSNNLTNHSATFGTGKINNCLNVVGGTFQSVADVAALRLTGSLTISLWINPSDLTGSTSFCIIAKNDGSNGWSFRINHGSPAQVTFINVAGNIVQDPSGVVVATWYHFVVTWDGTTGILYRNGSAVDTETPGLTIASSTTELEIGRDPGHTTQFFNGAVDEVGIWSRVLSSTEVTQLYNSGNGIQYPFTAGNGPSRLALLGVG